MEKEIKFEEAMASLEEIVRKLESGELPLDEAISAYERAVTLVKLCNGKLEAVESKIKLLSENADGTVSESDFGENAD